MKQEKINIFSWKYLSYNYLRHYLLKDEGKNSSVIRQTLLELRKVRVKEKNFCF